MAVFRLRSEARFASPRACYLAAWVAQPRLEKDDCFAVHVASLLSWPGRPVACDSKDGSVLDFFPGRSEAQVASRSSAVLGRSSRSI